MDFGITILYASNGFSEGMSDVRTVFYYIWLYDRFVVKEV